MAFERCDYVKNVTIGNNVIGINAAAFGSCSQLFSIELPSSLTSINGFAFANCSGMTSITCKAVTPPALGIGYGTSGNLSSNNVFTNVDKSIPLYVPYKSIDAYKAAHGWKEFTNILPIPGTEPEKFIVTFQNYDGTELQSSELEIGVIPEYTGATPTKPADAQYTYTFGGWAPEVGTVTRDMIYTAVFETTLNKYSVTWQDEDGNPIKTDEVAYGETPVFSGATPTKAATAEYTYEFAGWLPKIKEVTENVKYTTFFERNKIEPTVYTVNINGENCSLNISNNLPAGATLQVEVVADECLEFEKWSDGETANPRRITVTDDANLTAEFNKVTYTITGETENEGGEVQIIP